MDCKQTVRNARVHACEKLLRILIPDFVSSTSFFKANFPQSQIGQGLFGATKFRGAKFPTLPSFLLLVSEFRTKDKDGLRRSRPAEGARHLGAKF